MSNQASTQSPNDGDREDIEMLLPWYVNGTLDHADKAKVDAYLTNHPDMQTQLATLREDMSEAIHANETIAGPSGAALGQLMDQIDAEAPAQSRFAAAGSGLFDKIESFLRSLSPGRLSFAAIAAAAVIMLQAGVVGTMLMNTPPKGTVYQTASGGKSESGSYVLVKFQPAAPFAEISAFLASSDAEIVSGPKPGDLFRIRISVEKLDEATQAKRISALQAQQKLFALVLPAQ